VGRFQHEEGGIVEEILARNGVNVVTGDVLLRLDDMIPRANLGVVAGAGINPADWTNDIFELSRLLGELSFKFCRRSGAKG